MNSIIRKDSDTHLGFCVKCFILVKLIDEHLFKKKKKKKKVLFNEINIYEKNFLNSYKKKKNYEKKKVLFNGISKQL